MVSGVIGIDVIVEVIKRGKRIVFVNKEIMVLVGVYINKFLKEYLKVEIVLVDSEYLVLF